MSVLRDGAITCSVCHATFDVGRDEPVLSRHRLKTHEVYRCPHCSYYVAVPRPAAPRLT